MPLSVGTKILENTPSQRSRSGNGVLNVVHVRGEQVICWGNAQGLRVVFLRQCHSFRFAQLSHCFCEHLLIVLIQGMHNFHHRASLKQPGNVMQALVQLDTSENDCFLRLSHDVGAWALRPVEIGTLPSVPMVPLPVSFVFPNTGKRGNGNTFWYSGSDWKNCPTVCCVSRTSLALLLVGLVEEAALLTEALEGRLAHVHGCSTPYFCCCDSADILGVLELVFTVCNPTFSGINCCRLLCSFCCKDRVLFCRSNTDGCYSYRSGKCMLQSFHSWHKRLRHKNC